MKNFIQRGEVISVTAPANVTSGGGVLVGSLFGVACFDALSGAPLEIETTGVYDLPKVSAQAWTQGALIYWNATDKVASTTASGNPLIGVAVAAAANPTATGRVRLNGSFAPTPS